MKLSFVEWTRLANFSIVQMDDYSCVLGAYFMDRAKAVLIPHANTMCLLAVGKACMVSLSRWKPSKAKFLGAMQLAESCKEYEAKREALKAQKDLPLSKRRRSGKKAEVTREPADAKP